MLSFLVSVGESDRDAIEKCSELLNQLILQSN